MLQILTLTTSLLGIGGFPPPPPAPPPEATPAQTAPATTPQPVAPPETAPATPAPAAPAPAAPAPAPGAPAAAPPSIQAAAPPPAAASAPVPTSAARSGQADAEKPKAEEQEDSGWNRYNVTAMISAGVAVALLGTAAFFGASASSHESDVNRLVGYRNPPPEYAGVAGTYTSAMNDGHRAAHDARVALIAAAATGAVSITFFILDGVLTPATGAPTAAVAPVPHGMAAVGGWSWKF
jgi:hypothetical protein